jgi:hypothetical protein
MPITAGLWTWPLPSALVSSSFPYSKSFFVYDRIWYSVLVMEVKTGYDQAAWSMSVQINGTEVGKVFPRPWPGGPNLEPISFTFPNGMLNANNVANQLTPIPAGNLPEDYLIIGNWYLHYFQFLP